MQIVREARAIEDSWEKSVEESYDKGNIYEGQAREHLVKRDELSPMESAFMEGYEAN